MGENSRVALREESPMKLFKPVTFFSYLLYSICNLNKEKNLNICVISLEISRLFPAYPTFSV